MNTQSALAMFAALAQETRLGVFRLLVREEPTGLAAGEIARRVGTPANTMSTNLAILERCGLVMRERQGRQVIYRANLEGASDLLLYLVQDCCRGNAQVCAPVASIVEEACACTGEATAARGDAA